MTSPIITSILAATIMVLPSALFAIDTDSDGLDDAVETNTGIYVSPVNTGTKPNHPDSDGDGAGDWYEVATIDVAPTAAQPNAPNSPAIKPNIPYPLPAPDGSTGATNKPVKVYILSGQSNMVGQGEINPLGTAGTLSTITRNEGKFPNLLNGAGWSARNDVRYRGVIAATGNALLTAGQGGSATTIGPELGFGHVMGYYHDEPVLVLKSSEGGRGLGWDFLPPGSGSYTVGSTTYAGYGDSPGSWTTGTTPVPTAFYGGYQYDLCFLRKADWASAGAPNPALTNVTTVLDDFANQYPQWATQGFEIAGFAWFQGWNDGLSYTSAYANRYEQNMARFIRQIRSYYESRYPGKIKAKAPFVIATCAFEGWNESYLNQYPTRRAVINAQLAMMDPKYPDFVGNVKTMEARGYWRDKSISPSPGGNQGFHYNRHAETFMLVGDALGRGMIDLVSSAVPDTTPPAITGTNPADNATGVALSANLVLTFSESVAMGTGDITLKNLTDGTQSTIAITDPTQVSLLGAVLTINPTADLAGGKSYAIQIDPAALKDLANNPFVGVANDTTWNFTTALPDLTAPTPDPMTWATPPTALSSTSITMTANTANDPSGVQYFFDCTTAGGHDSTWQDSLTYTDTGLSPATSYAYTVKARDKSPANHETASSSAQSTTTTAPDTTAPAISTFSPADTATGVALSANLVLTFTEAIAIGTGNLTIKNLTNSTQVTIAITDGSQVSVAGAVLTINPTANLAGSKSYAIQLDAGAIKDVANNVIIGIADDTTWNFTTAAPPVNVPVTIVGNPVEGFLNAAKNGFATSHLGATQISYDATGADKLVVAIGTEAGNNNQKVNSVSLSFNGIAMTSAVLENTIFDSTPPLPGDWDGGYAGIFTLDNPFQGPASFAFSASTSSGAPNGAHVTIIGLAGTGDGVGQTSASWATLAAAGNVSTSITTSAGNSMVIAMVENSGRNNGSGTANLASGSPLTLAHNGLWGSSWGTSASAYQTVPASSTTITPTFNTNAGGNIHVIAAEFLALQLPADTTPPTLVSIVDDKRGAPIPVDTLVTYTVTFSEDMDAATVSAADFGNADTTAVTIGTVTEPSPGIFTVPVTPTRAGEARLQVNAGAELKDTAGNLLDTASAFPDDTPIIVNAAYVTWTGSAFAGTLTNTNPALDFDGGSLPTGIEWVVGGDPTQGSDDAGLAPTIDTTTDPNGKLLFIFRRTTAAEADANTLIRVEYGSDLTGWTSATHQGSGPNEITLSEQPNGFGAGIAKVTAALPPGLVASGKIFARLKVVVATE